MSGIGLVATRTAAAVAITATGLASGTAASASPPSASPPSASPPSAGRHGAHRDAASVVTRYSALNSVAATASGAVWAVGEITTRGTPSASATLIERFTAGKWHRQASPSPGGANGDSELSSVAALSASAAWAVGAYGPAMGTGKALIERWNGKSWKVTAGATLSAKDQPSLNGIAAVSASNAWIVGDVSNTSRTATFIEHWNGRSWKRVPSPNPGTAHFAVLRSVSAFSASDLWASGTYQRGNERSFRYVPFTLHWNGRKWREFLPPAFGTGHFFEFADIDAAPAGRAWAVGSTGLATFQPVIEQFNGSVWRNVASPDPGGASAGLGGVLSTRTGAWAVGSIANSRGYQVPLIERWNGKRWELVTKPAPRSAKADAGLASVAAISASNVWAVGAVSNSPLAEHWNGKKWSVVRTPALS
jgi:hypothetical protein